MTTTSGYQLTTKDLIEDLLAKDLEQVRAAGAPWLTELDAILMKIVKRKPLTELEHVRFNELSKALGMSAAELTIRAEKLAGTDPYYRGRPLVPISDYRRVRTPVFGEIL